jgi:hypothetical protein
MCRNPPREINANYRLYYMLLQKQSVGKPMPSFWSEGLKNLVWTWQLHDGSRFQ